MCVEQDEIVVLCDFAKESRAKKMNSTAALQSQSLGPASQLFMALIQSLIASRANVSPPEMWPADRGPYEKGRTIVNARKIG